MKAIFLDIDGVLNGTGFLGKGLPTICPMAVANLNKVVEATGAAVVITSTWRDKIHNGQMSIAGFAFLLRTHGLDCEIEGITERDDRLTDRGQQVSKFLRDNRRIEKYVVIDDQDNGLSRHPFVKTDGRYGMSSKDADRCIEILGEAEKKEAFSPLNKSDKPTGIIIP